MMEAVRVVVFGHDIAVSRAAEAVQPLSQPERQIIVVGVVFAKFAGVINRVIVVRMVAVVRGFIVVRGVTFTWIISRWT
jgi:hypothetical protein